MNTKNIQTIFKHIYSIIDIKLKVKDTNIWKNLNHSQNMMNSVIDTSYNKSVPILGQTQTNGELTSTSASPLAESLMTNKDNKSATKIKRSSFSREWVPTGPLVALQKYSHKKPFPKKGGGHVWIIGWYQLNNIGKNLLVMLQICQTQK